MERIVLKSVACLSAVFIVLTSFGQQKTENEMKENVIPLTINPETYKTDNEKGMAEVFQFVKDCGYYMIATVDGDQPRVRPFGTINIFEGKLYIQTGHKKKVAKQIAANGKIEICAYDEKKHTWIRIAGTLVEDVRVEAKRDMLDHYPELRKMYDEGDDNTAVFFFTDATAVISCFTEPDREIRF